MMLRIAPLFNLAWRMKSLVLVLGILASNSSALGVSKRLAHLQRYRQQLTAATTHRRHGGGGGITSSSTRCNAPTSNPLNPRRGTILAASNNFVCPSSPFGNRFSKSARVSTSLRGGAAAVLAATSAAAGAPPLGTWIFPALTCALSYALYNICIKKASASIDPMLGGALLQFVAAILGTLVLLGKRAVAGGQAASRTVPTRAAGIQWAMAAGVAVGMAEILSFVISGMGVQAMQSIPIVIGGSVVFGTVLGTVWLKEALAPRGWCGVVLIALGIALVGMDPGNTGIH